MEWWMVVGGVGLLFIIADRILKTGLLLALPGFMALLVAIGLFAGFAFDDMEPYFGALTEIAGIIVGLGAYRI